MPTCKWLLFAGELTAWAEKSPQDYARRQGRQSRQMRLCLNPLMGALSRRAGITGGVIAGINSVFSAMPYLRQFSLRSIVCNINSAIGGSGAASYCPFCIGKINVHHSLSISRNSFGKRNQETAKAFPISWDILSWASCRVTAVRHKNRSFISRVF
jgi:hypothetical protein